MYKFAVIELKHACGYAPRNFLYFSYCKGEILFQHVMQ